MVGEGRYILFGGVKQGDEGSVGPTDEVYSLRISKDKCNWQKLTPRSKNGQMPLPRTQHIAIALNDDRLWIFGGHHSPNSRLNDVWILDPNRDEWWCPDWQKEVTPNNQACPSGGPCPRANSAATLYKHGDKVYLFGGHGGLNYQRMSFNDLFSYDVNEHTWTKIETDSKPPEARGGHSMFWVETKLYIYGGWNNEYQYENIYHFDVESGEWYEPEIGGTDIVPRWNHSAIMVEAIPSWKYFIFGGETGDFMEGGPRAFGDYQNISRFLDIETMAWQSITTEDVDEKGGPILPKSREYSSMTYDSKDSRLILFGGWSNEWLNDIYTLNVSQIVGPPYAISEIVPNLGQLSGNTTVKLRGIGFIDTASINIRFTCGKQYVEIPGEYVSETEITAMTKSFEEIGPKEAEVRLQI